MFILLVIYPKPVYVLCAQSQTWLVHKVKRVSDIQTHV